MVARQVIADVIDPKHQGQRSVKRNDDADDGVDCDDDDDDEGEDDVGGDDVFVILLKPYGVQIVV